jgi:hypothetical protein
MVVHAAKTINNKPSLSHQSSTFFRVVFQPSKKMGCFMALYGIVLPTLAQQIALYKTGKSIHQGTEKSFTDMPRVIFPSTSRAWAHGWRQ